MAIVTSSQQVLPVGVTDPGTYYLTMQPNSNGITYYQYAGSKVTYVPATGNLSVPAITTSSVSTGTVTISGSGSSISTTTGALTVGGGVGIGGNLNVGGTATATVINSTAGMIVMSQSVAANTVIPAGYNVISISPWSVLAGSTFALPSGSRHVIL